MLDQRPLDVVFLTNFSDYCYRSIPAIAQMADDFHMRLTIVNTTRQRHPTDEDRARLTSFFPEADSYPMCRRFTMKGDPVDAVKRLSMVDPVDLLIAPASDPLGLPRFWHASLRTRLLRELGVPLWTIDRRTQPSRLHRAPRRVGCWIDSHGGSTGHLAFAAQYASATGAELHVLHALPEIAEGAMLVHDQPLHRNAIVDAVTRAVGALPVPTRVHVADNDRTSTRTRLMERIGLDVVFAADADPRLPSWLAPQPAFTNACLCPVVYVPVETAVPLWRLSKERPAPVEDLVLSMASYR